MISDSEGRNRRPPMDNVNCLLSFLYTMLMHDVRSALECVGLARRSGFCTVTGLAGQACAGYQWKNSGRSSPDRLTLFAYQQRTDSRAGV